MPLPPSIESYVAPARTRPGFWLVILSVLFIFGFWIGWTVLVLTIWTAIEVASSGDVQAALGGLEKQVTGSTPPSLLILLLTFAGIWMGVWMGVSVLHGQRFETIFAPVRGRAAGDFLRGAALAVLFSIVTMTLVVLLVGAPERSGLSIGNWAVFLIPIIVMIFVQATAEELIFRGYLLQQIARRTAHPLLWGALPAFLFGLLHFDPSLPQGGGYYYVAVTFLTGCTMAALVWRTGNLWAAIGMHVGINVLAITGAGLPELLSGMQLYSYDMDDLGALMRIDLVASLGMLAFVLSPFAPFPARTFPMPEAEAFD